MSIEKVTPEMEQEIAEIVSQILSEAVGRYVIVKINTDIGWEGKSLLAYAAAPPLSDMERATCDRALRAINEVMGGAPMIKVKSRA